VSSEQQLVWAKTRKEEEEGRALGGNELASGEGQVGVRAKKERRRRWRQKGAKLGEQMGAWE